MRRLLVTLISICLVAGLAGCKLVLPQPVSATVEQYKSGSNAQPVELSSIQLVSLSGWFSQRASGWERSVVTYVPRTVIRIKHSNGDTSTLNVLGNSVIANNQEGQYVQQFSPEDIRALYAVLAITAG